MTHPHRRRPILNLHDAHGQTMAEYALILALVFTIVLVTVAIYGGWVAGLWNNFNNSF